MPTPTQISALLKKKRPTHRQGYSDRTAWLMAWLSEIAYLDTGPKLNSELKNIKASLQWQGSAGGTQCIIVKLDNSYVLAFRGTEKKYEDFKTDIQANKIPSLDGGQIHSGFHTAYNIIKHSLKTELQELMRKEELPLYITGHSLGGALATIATRNLDQQKFKIAACYTFGAPKVGNDEWIYALKSPVYRVVNAVDAVTMLPPTLLLGMMKITTSWIPFIRKAFSKWIYQKYGEYMHAGDMRYLTNITDRDFTKVQLLPHVNWIYRTKQYLRSKKNITGFLADHKISIYKEKLFIIAERRNR